MTFEDAKRQLTYLLNSNSAINLEKLKGEIHFFFHWVCQQNNSLTSTQRYDLLTQLHNEMTLRPSIATVAENIDVSPLVLLVKKISEHLFPLILCVVIRNSFSNNSPHTGNKCIVYSYYSPKNIMTTI